MANQTKRRLAAILSADVVGYSRLMGADEAGTHERLMACRGAIYPLIAAHDGRVVSTAGDSILADFPSVVEALSAAVDVQAALRERNGVLPPEQRIEFRIGINVGDVIIDGDDIFGEGVNVAARLEALADPGGICISGKVYDEVRNKVEVGFRDRGAVSVKNIAEPVRVYSVAPDGAAVRSPPRALRQPRLAVLAGIGSLAVIAAGGVAAWLMLEPSPSEDPPSVATTGPDEATQPAPADAKPTIAVLPFDDQGGEEYFADGVTEDVITDLGRFGSLLVMSWNAMRPYRDQPVTPQQLGDDLDVRYVVEGSIRQAGDRVRVAVRLTDAERGTVLWSDRYDEPLDDVFVLQDQITRNVVGTLAVRVSDVEHQRVVDKPTDSLQAYDHVLRGRERLRASTRSANLEARDHFERAIALDSDYAAAHVGVGWTHLFDAWWGWSPFPPESLERAAEWAERAVELGSETGGAYTLLGQVYLMREDYDRAARAAEKAIELNPNDAESQAHRGMIELHTGRPEQAARTLEAILRIDPNPVQWVWDGLGQSYFLLERYEDAIAAVDNITEDDAAYLVSQVTLAATYATTGQLERAGQAAANVRRRWPFFDSAQWGAKFGDPIQGQKYVDALRAAGLD